MKNFVVILILVLGVSKSYSIEFEDVRMNGYFSFEYEDQFNKDGNGDKNGSFDLDLIDLLFDFQPNDKVRVSLDVTWEHGAVTEDDKGNVAIEHAFTEYAFKDTVKFQAGKFLVPFGYFNEVHTAKPSFLSIKEAAATNKPERIVSNAFRFYPRWATGIQLVGEVPLKTGLDLDYNLLMANGNDASDDPQHEEDENGNKAFGARTRIHYDSKYEIGLSYWDDESTIDSITSHGVFGNMYFGSLQFVFEYTQGEKEVKATKVKTKQTGYFLQASYLIEAWNLTPYTRYEFIDPDDDTSKDTGTNTIIGINFEPEEGFILKLEDNFIQGEENAQGLKDLPGKSYHEIKAAVVVGF
jgi:hypothetical protein